ncbi:MAG: hypothetical protein U0930_19660 [Pirellulales bacterium]
MNQIDQNPYESTRSNFNDAAGQGNSNRPNWVAIIIGAWLIAGGINMLRNPKMDVYMGILCASIMVIGGVLIYVGRRK